MREFLSFRSSCWPKLTPLFDLFFNGKIALTQEHFLKISSRFVVKNDLDALMALHQATVLGMNTILPDGTLGKFIDAPVRTYSSGMHSKLAFSITAILNTDIMLIDEVLSVGDAKFKKKSYAKMKELISDESRTVVIVSHDLKTVRSLRPVDLTDEGIRSRIYLQYRIINLHQRLRHSSSTYKGRI